MDDKREIFGWAMYDWANSAYVLTVATAILPAYFAATVVGPGGVELDGFTVSATTLWGLSVSLASGVVFLAAPVLGAVADLTGAKKRFLAAFCAGGSLCVLMLAFRGAGDVFSTLALFSLAQALFACGNVFYDAFLPEIASPTRRDHVSGLGYAYGYVGGGLQFLCALALVALHGSLGLDAAQAARAGMGMAAVWWAGFALITFRLVRERPGTSAPMPPARLVAQGLRRAAASARLLLKGGPAGLFLAAYLLFNDGIQTVVAMATIYGKEELRLSTTVLMLTLLLIQGVAFAGALAFTRLARRITAKGALMAALAVWAGVSLYAYLLEGAVQYFILGGLVGLVLGGSQALARSLYAALIPAEASAQYFGYFSVITKLSAVGGPLVFALVNAATGSSRPAVLVVGCFFVAGMAILSRVRVPPAAAP